MKLSRDQLAMYVQHYCACVKMTAKARRWEPAELAAALAMAEETTRKVLKRQGHQLPPRRRVAS